jgi:glutamate-5-semialdehyde dehydrogenase
VLARLDDAGKAAALALGRGALARGLGRNPRANARDLAAGEANGMSPAMLDRLRLDEQRLEASPRRSRQVAALPDQVGEVIDRSVARAGSSCAACASRSG